VAEIERDAWLFRAGRYADKGVDADPALLDTIASNTNRNTIAPSLDLEHGPTERVLPFGRLVPGSVRRVHGAPPGGEPGEWLVGRVAVNPEIYRNLAARGLSVLLDTATKAIAKVAVTATPRVRGAQFSEPDTGLAEFRGGYLMPETPIVPAPEAPAVDTQGLIAGVVAGIKGLFAKPEAQADPPAAPAFSMADVEAKLAEERVAFSAKLADTEKRADEAEAKANQQALAAFSTQAIAKGVPPYMVEALAPFAVGLPKATVAFSADGKTETREVEFAEAARIVLTSAEGTVPMKRVLPSDDNREVAFADAVSAKAAEYQKADPKLSKSAAMERAALEVTNG